MGLPIKGATGGSGMTYQGNQGMAKGPASGNQGKVGVVKMGVAAKTQNHITAKSKKKKVIVNALLRMMQQAKKVA